MHTRATRECIHHLHTRLAKWIYNHVPPEQIIQKLITHQTIKTSSPTEAAIVTAETAIVTAEAATATTERVERATTASGYCMYWLFSEGRVDV